MPDWIDNADSYICPICRTEIGNPAKLNYTCPKCGFVADKDKSSVDFGKAPKMRLIDANAEAAWAMENLPEPHSGVVIQFLRDCGTIDPETLPIVRELRKKLEQANTKYNYLLTGTHSLTMHLDRVTAERDVAQSLLAEVDPVRDGGKITTCFGYPLDKVYTLVQAHREGRCIAFPFSVGQTVWTNVSVRGDRYRESDKPYPVTVRHIGIGGGGCWYFNVQYNNGRVFPFDMDSVGKTVFLTKKAAVDAGIKEEKHE